MGPCVSFALGSKYARDQTLSRHTCTSQQGDEIYKKNGKVSSRRKSDSGFVMNQRFESNDKTRIHAILMRRNKPSDAERLRVRNGDRRGKAVSNATNMLVGTQTSIL